MICVKCQFVHFKRLNTHIVEMQLSGTHHNDRKKVELSDLKKKLSAHFLETDLYNLRYVYPFIF